MCLAQRISDFKPFERAVYLHGEFTLSEMFLIR